MRCTWRSWISLQKGSRWHREAKKNIVVLPGYGSGFSMSDVDRRWLCGQQGARRWTQSLGSPSAKVMELWQLSVWCDNWLAYSWRKMKPYTATSFVLKRLEKRLTSGPKHAKEHLSEPLQKAMIFNGLPECYEHFVVHESFNPASSFAEI